MAHDFAKIRNKKRLEPTPPTPPPQPSKGMLLTGVLTGLILGFFASFLIYLSGVLPPIGGDNRQVDLSGDQAAEALAAQQRRNEELEQAAARLQLEFYKELPNYEVIVDNMPIASAVPSVAPPAAPSQAATAPQDTPAPSSTPVSEAVAAPPVAELTPSQGSYMIQAGAFQQESSAQTQSSRLILLGLQTQIKKEALLGKTLYLVQAGPYQTREQLTQAERLLRANNIDSIRIGLSQ